MLAWQELDPRLSAETRGERKKGRGKDGKEKRLREEWWGVFS